MRLNRNFLTFVCFFQALLYLAVSPSFAADRYNINSGSTVTVNEHGTCKKVKNNNSAKMMVPTKSSGEWSSFRSNAPNVTLSNCSRTWKKIGTSCASNSPANTTSTYCSATSGSCSSAGARCRYAASSDGGCGMAGNYDVFECKY